MVELGGGAGVGSCGVLRPAAGQEDLVRKRRRPHRIGAEFLRQRRAVAMKVITTAGDPGGLGLDPRWCLRVPDPVCPSDTPPT